MDVVLQAAQGRRIEIDRDEAEGLVPILGQQGEAGHLLREQERDTATHLPRGADDRDERELLVEVHPNTSSVDEAPSATERRAGVNDWADDSLRDYPESAGSEQR